MYPLTKHTLHQMFNNVKLQVDYECEMAYELLRLVKKQLKEGYGRIVGIKSLLEVTAVKVLVTAAKHKLVLICTYGGCIQGSNAQPGEFEIWRMRIEQYIQMIDYALWEVIENGNSAPKTIFVEGVEKVIPPTTVEEKDQKRLEDAKLLLEAIEKRFRGNAATKKTQRNLLKQHTNEPVNTSHGVSAVSTQVSAANSTNVDNLSDAVICAFFSS
ncbi:hypothetical protein Tco_1254721 [Tanacetum coccineum]